MNKSDPIQAISVIVPANPFVPEDLQQVKHCLAALNVRQLMQWWPGTPHTPHRSANKVKAIQRSLDWKRVAQIAAYLLQREIVDAPHRLDRYFRHIYQPKALEPGREWPPKLPKVVGFQRSEYPTFSNVLLHVNGATIKHLPKDGDSRAAKLVFDEQDRDLNFSVIDGQHRINGAFLAVSILREQEEHKSAEWEIPAEIFIDLDERSGPPRRQAQIFIDVNFHQKKVDKSLVADLFPTARGPRGPLDNKERAQDLGRKLMLEVGPLVGMVQIPGIKFGVKDVVTLATLNSAIEDVLDDLFAAKITSLDTQAEFLGQCLEAWLEATGRKEDVEGGEGLDPENVAYQGRVVVSFLTLLPACIWKLRKGKLSFVSDAAKHCLVACRRSTHTVRRLAIPGLGGKSVGITHYTGIRRPLLQPATVGLDRFTAGNAAGAQACSHRRFSRVNSSSQRLCRRPRPYRSALSTDPNSQALSGRSVEA